VLGAPDACDCEAFQEASLRAFQEAFLEAFLEAFQGACQGACQEASLQGSSVDHRASPAPAHLRAAPSARQIVASSQRGAPKVARLRARRFVSRAMTASILLAARDAPSHSPIGSSAALTAALVKSVVTHMVTIQRMLARARRSDSAG
jgi:hypothetical protein